METDDVEEISRRTDMDLDSIEYGTPKGGKIKIYFNTNEISANFLEAKVKIAIQALALAKQHVDALGQGQ